MTDAERALNLLLTLEGVVFAADPKQRPMLAQSVVREIARRALAGVELDPQGAVEAQSRGVWDITTPTEALLLLDGAGVLAKIEDHQPGIGSWIDDSTWLDCSCGWDSSAKDAVGWFEHLAVAVRKR